MDSVKRLFYFLCLLLPPIVTWGDCPDPFLIDTSYYYENTYRRAVETTQNAERCIQYFYFQSAPIHYKQAQALLALSEVEDKSLLFRIELGLALSEVFNNGDVTLGHRLRDIFNKFTSNSPPDKIKFESIGDTDERESVHEAK